jgi:hypothetical protein
VAAGKDQQLEAAIEALKRLTQQQKPTAIVP